MAKKQVIKIKNEDGTVSYGMAVTVRPFKRVWKSHPTEKAARAWHDKLTAELKKQREAGNSVRPDLTTYTLASLNKDYLADAETAVLKDLKDRRRHLTWWTSHYGAEKVIEFGVLRLREGRDKLIPGRAPATVDQYLASQRAAWNWGCSVGLIPNDRIWPPRLMLTKPPARVRYLSDEELTAVLAAAKKHSPTLLAAVTLALACGCRAGEQMRLTWADIDFTRARIRLLITKNGQARSVHLPTIAADALKAIKSGTVVGAKSVFVNRYGKPLTTQGLDRQWRVVRKEAGLTDFRWHDFRHSCASFLAQHGATLLEIGSVLGHKSAQVTMKYAHLVEGKAVTGHAALDSKLRNA